MSVNPELLDSVFEATKPYVVGREKVQEFSSAVFATPLIHHVPGLPGRLGRRVNFNSITELLRIFIGSEPIKTSLMPIPAASALGKNAFMMVEEKS